MQPLSAISICAAACLAFVVLPGLAENFNPPGGLNYAHTSGNLTILPGGRALKPLGNQINVGPGAFGLAISPKGLIGVAETGFERFGVAIVEPRKDQWRERLFWAAPKDDDDSKSKKGKDRWESVTYGIAFDSDKHVWVSEGDSGKVRLLDTDDGDSRRMVDIDSDRYRNSYTGDLAIDPVRHVLYVLDPANERLVLIDTKKYNVLSSIPTGHMPVTVALSPDRNTAYVANIGMFRYRVLPGVADDRSHALPFPALAFPSSEPAPGVPPLGDPNARESNSISVIDVRNTAKPAVTGWIRTGPAVGATIPTGTAMGGSAPFGILPVDDKIYVSNSHSDTVTVISATDHRILGNIALRVPWLQQLRGFIPAGMAYDPTFKWLLVAEAGINAVGVIDTTRNVVIAHLPVGLYPTRVGIADRRVFVVNARGRGSGSNARRPLEDDESRSTFYRGSVSTFPMPAASDLQKLTALTFQANGFFTEQSLPSTYPSAIRHVVLIVKENRAYDEVLGDIPRASNSKAVGNAALARFGLAGLADGHHVRFSIKDAAVTPNQHAIAKQFAFSDNFYADGDTDVDGHHWFTGVIPDLFTMSGMFQSYGGQRQFILDDASPGRLLFAGTSAGVLPEEIPENGTLWDHLERHHITFRNFGEGLELPGVEKGHTTLGIGAQYLTNVPIQASLYRHTAPNYPAFSFDIPDQTRASRLIAELDSRYKSGKEAFPQFLYITLPNDHIGDDRPKAGYPYGASWVADNDLALGRILEYLSHSPWWREMAVFITEDSAAGGIDLVDAHRTVLLAAGPWVRRDYVSHTNTSIPGLLKTIFQIFHLPALNLMDQTAATLADVFTDTPDFTPFTALSPDNRIFDPAALNSKE
ncbi:MAG TPA: bifunctional YncE family protein/alkaline phosphatase family protein [Bryobacteraceae bacterium]|nr:bifunctional YncE family protein/alkaline phosphatase family protein [Bryobacteraceae bacterium]